MNKLEYTKDEWKEIERNLKLGYDPLIGGTLRSVSVKPKDNGWIVIVRYVASQTPLVRFQKIGQLDHIAHAVKEALEGGVEEGDPDKYWDNP